MPSVVTGLSCKRGSRGTFKSHLWKVESFLPCFYQWYQNDGFWVFSHTFCHLLCCFHKGMWVLIQYLDLRQLEWVVQISAYLQICGQSRSQGKNPVQTPSSNRPGNQSFSLWESSAALCPRGPRVLQLCLSTSPFLLLCILIASWSHTWQCFLREPQIRSTTLLSGSLDGFLHSSCSHLKRPL